MHTRKVPNQSNSGDNNPNNNNPNNSCRYRHFASREYILHQTASTINDFPHDLFSDDGISDNRTEPVFKDDDDVTDENELLNHDKKVVSHLLPTRELFHQLFEMRRNQQQQQRHQQDKTPSSSSSSSSRNYRRNTTKKNTIKRIHEYHFDCESPILRNMGIYIKQVREEHLKNLNIIDDDGNENKHPHRADTLVDVVNSIHQTTTTTMEIETMGDDVCNKPATEVMETDDDGDDIEMEDEDLSWSTVSEPEEYWVIATVKRYNNSLVVKEKLYREKEAIVSFVVDILKLLFLGQRSVLFECYLDFVVFQKYLCKTTDGLSSYSLEFAILDERASRIHTTIVKRTSLVPATTTTSSSPIDTQMDRYHHHHHQYTRDPYSEFHSHFDPHNTSIWYLYHDATAKRSPSTFNPWIIELENAFLRKLCNHHKDITIIDKENNKHRRYHDKNANANNNNNISPSSYQHHYYQKYRKAHNGCPPYFQ